MAGKFKSNQETLRTEAAGQSKQTREERHSSTPVRTSDISADSARPQQAAMRSSESADNVAGKDESQDSFADDSSSYKADNNSVIF